MKRTAALTAALAIAATALPVPFAGASMSEATFNHRANDICSAAGTKIENLPATDQNNVAKQVPRIAAIVTSMAAKLSKIEAPAPRKAKFKRFITLTRQSTTLIGQGVAAARAHHVNHSADLLYKGIKASQKSVTVATDIDLTECARDRFPGLTGNTEPSAGN
ncbi:MAG TPA: hypothetical protein VI318_02915 [Baekduia sp.]